MKEQVPGPLEPSEVGEPRASISSPMQDNLASLQKMRDEARQGGGPKRIGNQHGLGKLTAWERIDLLLDEGSFEEFDVLKAGRGAISGPKENT